MLVTITQFRSLARDEQNNVLESMGQDRTACQARTSAGAFTALEADTAFIRLATDTAIQMDIEGGSTTTADELFLPGEYFIAVNGGETLTIAAASSAGGSIGASESHIGEVGSPIEVINVTPAVDTAIYASGDVLFTQAEAASAIRVAGEGAVFNSLVVIDEADQKPAFNLVLFRSNVSLGAINGAPNVSDANAREVIGIVPVTALDYVDLGGVSVATVRNIGLPVRATAGTSIYLAAFLTAGTPTFGAETDIKLALGFLQG